MQTHPSQLSIFEAAQPSLFAPASQTETIATFMNASNAKAWMKIKDKYPDAVILIRANDNIIAYKEDAVIMERLLNLNYYHCNHLSRYSFFPASQLDVNMSKLVKAGHRVAIVEQLERSGFNF